MPEIVLTEEQARVLAGADEPVRVRNPDGGTVAVIDPQDAAALARAGRRADGPRYSAASVRAMFDALQAERDRVGSFDVAHAEALVARLERDDPATYGPLCGS